MRRTTATIDELRDIDALEERIQGRVIEARIEGEHAIVDYVPAATLDWHVNVWNCRGVIETSDETLDGLLATKGNRALYNRLVSLVVHDDNDGAINISGRYIPQSDAATALFDELVASVKDADK